MRKIAIGTLIGLVATLGAAPSANASIPSLADLVQLKDIRAHQLAFQQIAGNNGGNRASGEPGFEKSVNYVVAKLALAGYKPTIQRFAFPYYKEATPSVFAQTAPSPTSYTHGTDYRTLDYSGAGDVTATALAVDPDATGLGSGCEADDFAGFTAGSIALIRRGGCTFEVKTDNAQKAGASAVAYYQRPDVPDTPVEGTALRPFTIPLIGFTNKLGVELVQAAKAGDLKLRIKTDTISEQRTTSNIVAETPYGNPDHVVAVGGHLDSVGAGPGINDNGSGAGTVLAIAQKIGQIRGVVNNRVRFTFWGAEEGGDLGSKYYVANLSAEEKAKIALYLNFDMIGSPNGVRGVLDGDDSLGTNSSKPPTGSDAIEKVFTDYYAGRKLALKQDAFTGSSDYQPFMDAGIPAGGVRSGTDPVKTAEEAAVFGGTAGVPYDPCYHQACDTYNNVNTTLLDQLADGAAHATETFAKSVPTMRTGNMETPAAKKATRTGEGHTPAS
ncbi:M20/M25/M40 family metallo-hydrolase [Nonomuraea guangzhouensis]|uniref:M20/M25/M40 family metallo-hydrolase n=1 Tax=Nonomuraea guangzhouensis TaxID=1291555 RepID=A0ABW4G8E4_9ACTN|nr:M20/M25/M40 family metallo-hydrolase [Nonomuraea guangzhouensis]